MGFIRVDDDILASFCFFFSVHVFVSLLFFEHQTICDFQVHIPGFYCCLTIYLAQGLSDFIAG